MKQRHRTLLFILLVCVMALSFLLGCANVMAMENQEIQFSVSTNYVLNDTDSYTLQLRAQVENVTPSAYGFTLRYADTVETDYSAGKCNDDNQFGVDITGVKAGKYYVRAYVNTLLGRVYSKTYLAEISAQDEVEVYLIMGQSNAYGCSPKSSMNDETAEVNNAVLFYPGQYCSEEQRANVNFQKVTASSNISYEYGMRLVRFGPELGMGNVMYHTNGGKKVYYVKVAQGGSELYDRWASPSSGNTVTPGMSPLYTWFEETLTSSKKYFTDNGMNAVLKGLAWMQGESDAMYEHTANAYETNLRIFFQDVATTIQQIWNQDVSENFPVIIGGIRTNYNNMPYADTVIAAQKQIASENQDFTFFESRDLDVHDGWHYTGDGGLELGRRFGKALMTYYGYDLSVTVEPIADFNDFSEVTPTYTAYKPLTSEKQEAAGDVVTVTSEQGTRTTLSLNGYWECHATAFNDAVGALPTDFSNTIPVPGLWDMAQNTIGASYTNKAVWYKKTVAFNGDANKNVTLKINKAYWGKSVYVNGEYIGEDYTVDEVAYFDITSAIKGDGVANEILIKIGSKDTQSGTINDEAKTKYIPGIYDDVELIIGEEVRSVAVMPDVESKRANVAITLINASSVEKTLQPTVTVRGKDGFEKIERLASAVVPANDSLTVQANIDMTGCVNWTPTTPERYTVTVTTQNDTYTDTFAMKTFVFSEDMATLNGDRYYVLGANVYMHRFFEETERGELPWNEEWVKALLTQYKSIHINSICFRGGKAPELWYDLCEEMGLLVIEETGVDGYLFDNVNFDLSYLNIIDTAELFNGKTSLVADYGWLWLTRNGEPSAYTAELYNRIFKSGYTSEELRYFQAKATAQLTEFWRASGQTVGIMQMGLGGGKTADSLSNVAMPEYHEVYRKLVGDAYNPLAIVIEDWSEWQKTGSTVAYSVSLVNDYTNAVQKEVTLSLYKGAKHAFSLSEYTLVDTQKQNFTVGGSQKTTQTFNVSIPNDAKVCYKLVASYEQDGETVVSVRDFAHGAPVLRATTELAFLSANAVGDVANVADGKLDTAWTGTDSATQSLVLDLGEKYSLYRLLTVWNTDMQAKEYDVYASDDQTVWRKVGMVKYGGQTAAESVTLQGSGRYIKLELKKGNGSGQYGIIELKVYGGAYTGEETTPPPATSGSGCQSQTLTPVLSLLSIGFACLLKKKRK